MWANELTGYDTLKKTRLVLCYTVMFFALQWFCNLDLTLPETRNPLSTSVFDPSLSQKCLLVNPVSTGVNLLHAAVGCAQRWLISSNKNRQTQHSKNNNQEPVIPLSKIQILWQLSFIKFVCLLQMRWLSDLQVSNSLYKTQIKPHKKENKMCFLFLCSIWHLGMSIQPQLPDKITSHLNSSLFLASITIWFPCDLLFFCSLFPSSLYLFSQHRLECPNI